MALTEYNDHEIYGHVNAPKKEQPAYVGNFLRATSEHLKTLGHRLAGADRMPDKRTKLALEIAGEVRRTAEQLQERAIKAALSKGDLTVREIAALTGLPKSSLHDRYRQGQAQEASPREGEPLDAC